MTLSPRDPRLFTHLYIPLVCLFVVVELIVIGTTASECSIQDSTLQWQWLLLFGLLFGATASWETTARSFYSGGKLFANEVTLTNSESRESFWTLTLSSFITWVFAKSVYNASVLGAEFGWVGGLSYAMYYISFLSAALVIAAIRGQRFNSLPSCIHEKYGRGATASFLLAVSYRLFNEVWSNSIVVADFYGPRQSGQWWGVVVVGTLIPAGYVFAGGMRTSLYTDVFQALAAIVFFAILMGVLGSRTEGVISLVDYNPVPSRKMWSLAGGFDLFLVAMLQGMFSYPFFDPVLTDRAFLCSVRVMVASFVIGGTISAIYIFCFSMLGVYGAFVGVGGIPSDVAAYIGPAIYSIVSLIMITSSLSTLDSTFTSTSKAWGLEVVGFATRGRPITYHDAGDREVMLGRVAIVLMTIVGTLPLVGDPVILNATTISGTVVMGLGPPVIGGIFFGPRAPRLRYRLPLAFHLSFWLGVAFGVAIQVGAVPAGFDIGGGTYGVLLGYNLYGLLSCLLAYVVGLAIHAFLLPHDVVASSSDDDERNLEKGVREVVEDVAAVEDGDEEKRETIVVNEKKESQIVNV